MAVVSHAIRTMAVSLTLMLAMMSPVHGQVAETITDSDTEVEVFDTPGDDSVLAADLPPDFTPDLAPVFAEPARADHRTAPPSLYSAEPDVARCEPGTLRNDARAGFVRALNAERARHGLEPVAYDAAWDQEAAAAALIMAANSSLSHEPPSSWRCWSASGAHGAGSSNLLLDSASGNAAPADDAGLVAQWLIEGGGDELGHRRWILDPYLARTTLGRVTQVLRDGSRIDSAVMKVFDFSGQSEEGRALAGSAPEFVAWPQGPYPKSFFSPRARFSFSVTRDQSRTATIAEVDFTQSIVAISDGTRTLPIHDQTSDNEVYGIPNCLSWRVDGVEIGPTYTVTITGIRGAPHGNYVYKFSIFKN